MSKFSPYTSSASNPRATPSTVCQKCLGRGHFTYQCKKSRPYVSRPSRSQLLENDKLREKEKERRKEILSEGIPEEFRNKTGVADALLTAREVARASGEKPTAESPPRKKLKRDETSSESDADSGSDSGSRSRSTSGSESDNSSGRSRSPRSPRSRRDDDAERYERSKRNRSRS